MWEQQVTLSFGAYDVRIKLKPRGLGILESEIVHRNTIWNQRINAYVGEFLDYWIDIDFLLKIQLPFT